MLVIMYRIIMIHSIEPKKPNIMESPREGGLILLRRNKIDIEGGPKLGDRRGMWQGIRYRKIIIRTQKSEVEGISRTC